MLPIAPIQAYQPDHRHPKIAKMPSLGRGLRDADKANDDTVQEQPQMRRLSSLASITQLNLFSRRRSTTTISESSTSNASTSLGRSSTLNNPDSAPLVTNAFSTESSDDGVAVSSHLSKSFASRRSTWIPIPEKAAIPISRSRTTSNLPVAVKRNSQLVIENTTRSRISTPKGSRNPARPRMPSVPKGILKTSRNRGLARSDTEPLLPSPIAKHTPKYPRATSFKENFTPTKAGLSSAVSSSNDDYRSSTSDVGKAIRNFSRCVDSSFAALSPDIRQLSTTQSSPVKSTYSTTYVQSLEHTINAAEAQLQASNALTQKRRSYGGEIKQHQLLSPKQPPTPKPEVLNPAAILPPSSPTKTSPEVDRYSPDRNTEHEEKTPKPKRAFNVDIVTVAEPVSYWCGRFVSMNDRLRHDEFDAMPMEENQAMESMADKRRRTMEIFRHLHSRCATDEARLSLRTFHAYLREMHTKTAIGDEEALVAYIPWGDIAGGKDLDSMDSVKIQRYKRESSVETGISDKSTSTTDSRRRSTFMERLLGKTKRAVS